MDKRWFVLFQKSFEFFSIMFATRGAASIFLRGGWSYGSKKPWKGKIACD